MAQQTTIQVNGDAMIAQDQHESLAVSAKRKRDSSDDGSQPNGGDHIKPESLGSLRSVNQKELVKSYYEVLKSIDINPPILKRPLSDPPSSEEPDAKRHKSAEPPLSISQKIAADGYSRLDEIEIDLVSAVKASLSELRRKAAEDAEADPDEKRAAEIIRFSDKALDIIRREKAYPKSATDTLDANYDYPAASTKGQVILSLVGYAPQEKRLFSSLPLTDEVNATAATLPIGVSATTVAPTSYQERTQTLGELFAPPRALPPLQAPKQPKTQAKGNMLDFYHPDIADASKPRGANYFTTKLSAGYYLDYSNATPSSHAKTKQRERAQSLAGKKPSTTELELLEMESLFRGAFSSFAPSKDDSAAVVASSTAGRMWWQQAGHRNFQNVIELDYYNEAEKAKIFDAEHKAVEIDEVAIQEAIDNWDETTVDPSLEDAMGSKRDSQEKEADEILEEVSDLIETLSSYQRIRNLQLPNSQNRQSSDPVNGDMLANTGPQPSEEEQATYAVLKAQLALIVKTLPPFAVAKLNGDQLDELLISTKVQVQTDQYKGVMEEDEAGVQARLRAQQAAAAAQVNARPPAQRTPSISNPPYQNYYQAGHQYGTPNRTPAQPQQYYRPTATPNYQQPRATPQTTPNPQRPPQPNQYTRPNGFANQYATQLAKAQTPYGHQSMPQYASQQRPPYGQTPQQGTPNTRYQFQPGYPPQAGGANASNYGNYANGSPAGRNMSPGVPQRQTYSQSPNMPQAQRYATPGQPPSNQMNRFPSNPGQTGQQNQSPGITGYHTVIPEAQQQRILDQAKARVAAQERSALFGDKIAQPSVSGLAGIGLGGGTIDVNRLAAVRASFANQQKPQSPVGQRQGMNGTPVAGHTPAKVTPVPFPVIPSSQQSKP
ncbi:hypothetical protein S40288_08155 [Stachybotrys chartarum IBT 40288]|nr:hypothetical protein S40288_08155 [Stachybotrys chartarum IBT 40288]